MSRYLFGTSVWIFDRFTTWLSVFGQVAIIVIVSYFVALPDVKADIKYARINNFALFTSQKASFFEYNISVAIGVHNPDVAKSVTYTEPLASTVLFDEQHLYNDTFIYVGQKHPPRKVMVYLLHAVGQVPSHVMGTTMVDEYKKQNTTGVFNIEIHVSGEMTLGLGDRRKMSLRCPLSLRLAPSVVLERKVYCVPVEPAGKKYV
jgi:hypothetical protein